MIRISVSYLLRIELDGKYLLIRGGRYPDHFQPVGGVYKFNPSAKEKFRQWNVESDDLIPIDKASQDDLRIRIPGRHLLAFVRWFETGRNREIGPSREFYDELVQPTLLPLEKFAYIRCDFIERQIKRLRYSEFAQSLELQIADIYDAIPNPEQQEELLALQENNSEAPDTIWATADHIRRRGALPGFPQSYRISTTATWTL